MTAAGLLCGSCGTELSAICIAAGQYTAQLLGTPKVPGALKRVQPSRNTELRRENGRG